MKEKEFLEKIHTNEGEWNYLDTDEKIEIPIYYTIDDEENVLVDFEEMKEEFEDKLQKIQDILNKDDYEKGKLD